MDNKTCEDKNLDNFQSRLLELMLQPLSQEQRWRALKTDPLFIPYQNYIASFDPRMMEVAAQIIRKWTV